MTRLKLLGAAALVMSSALAGPAMAQQAISHPANCEARYPNANCRNLGPGNPYTGRYQRHAAYRDGNWNNGWQRESWQDNWNDNRRNSGFWPGDVAAGVVDGAVATAGAAVGTAGAIAAAPFESDSYAYDNGGGYDNGWNNNGWNNGWNNQSYAQRNGFVCTPGTWFKGEDGRRHLCQ
jgi:hypothetical protein